MGDHPAKHLKAAQEVLLGTTSPSGRRHATKLWIVVVDREVTTTGEGELLLLDDEKKRRFDVHAEHVDDPATLAQVTKAIKKKYGWTHPQYCHRFLDDDSVAATLRLDVTTV